MPLTMKFLRNLWDDSAARAFEHDGLELLRYRSNLLGADLRITNFGGGNTSSKLDLPDPFTGQTARVLAVKGSGGDLGSIKRQGFALLYLDKVTGLERSYRGEAYEDDMVAYYPLAAFGDSKVAASIDTPLHAFLPFDHVDHLHPDWAIALAASANGMAKLAEFNQRFGHNIVWLPWQRPGFELGLMLRRAVQDNAGCDGILLGSHGLFTWGNTQRESYENSIRVIDDLGQFVHEHEQRLGKKMFGGAQHQPAVDPEDKAAAVLPYLRGQLATKRRGIAHWDGSPEMLEFVNALDARQLARLGTSCPDHFIRTRISPMYVEWNPQTGAIDDLKRAISDAANEYRERYTAYYNRCAQPGSPALRDPNPSVVLIPGLGMFTFGKNKTEARITGEFYVNAKHVMQGATALGAETAMAAAAGNGSTLPQAKTAEVARDFTSYKNYVALPPTEAFRIEYWALEEAKIQRMPPEKELSRRIFLIIGGGAGIGRATALKVAYYGAHIMVADLNEASAKETAGECAKSAGKEAVAATSIDIRNRESIRRAIRQTILTFGGLDGVVNTAAVFVPPAPDGSLPDDKWQLTLDINVTGNYLVADEARKVMKEQGLPAVLVLTSSANAVVPKRGSEAYDVSKGAVNHLIRELAIGLAPLVRVNGIAPATVVEGSTMFPRDRVIASLTKYEIPFEQSESDDTLRSKLAQFYANRTLSRQPITPNDCAEAIFFLASDRSAKTSGHVIPVDGGLPEAFLR
jgi:rhamnose utilization protein RhaD (predicted bifunctional aldolase and dehydrogenase)/NAD(P)-dependent dehydrogenase (short-subunit alcohol dehydrogenase family)